MSRQNFAQRYNRYLEKREEMCQLEKLLFDLREEHPRMGALKLFDLLNPMHMGREKFQEFYRELGFTLHEKPNYRRTTNSNGVIRFPNLVDGLKVTTVNQVWVSDISYYQCHERLFFLTFIMDLYSRFILGYKASIRLLADHTTLPTLRMALRSKNTNNKPILHSDGGGQYYCKAFLSLARKNVVSSMAKGVYENAHAERINGIIKNEYLIPWNPSNFKQLGRLLKKAVYNYNFHRPHRSLNMKKPADVYQHINSFQQKKKEAKKKSLHLINHSDKSVNSMQ